MAEFTVYSKTTCKYCTMAKRLLEKHGRAYREVNIEDLPGLRSIILDAGYTTVPIIFVNGLYIGGYEDLTERLEPEDSYPAD